MTEKLLKTALNPNQFFSRRMTLVAMTCQSSERINGGAVVWTHNPLIDMIALMTITGKMKAALKEKEKKHGGLHV